MIDEVRDYKVLTKQYMVMMEYGLLSPLYSTFSHILTLYVPHPFWMTSSDKIGRFQSNCMQSNFIENMGDTVVSTAPADGPAPSGAVTSNKGIYG